MTCARCGCTGAAFEFDVLMESRVRVVEPSSLPDSSGRRVGLSVRVVSENVPVRMRCLSCENVVEFGDAAKLKVESGL